MWPYRVSTSADERGDLGLDRDVEPDRRRDRPDRRGDGADPGKVEVGDDDRGRPLGGEPLGQRPADAAGRAGDDDDPPGQLHGPPPTRRRPRCAAHRRPARSVPGAGTSAITGVRTPPATYVVELLAHLGRRAVQHQRVDQLVRDGRQRALAVAGRPGVPHRPEHRFAAEPAVERRVRAHRQVRRRSAACPRCARTPRRSVGHTKIRAATSNPSGRAGQFRGHRRDVGRREPVEDRPVGLGGGEPQHPRTQRGENSFGGCSRRAVQPEPAHPERRVLLVDRLAGQRRPQEPQHVAGARERVGEVQAVPLRRRSPATTRRCRSRPARARPRPARPRSSRAAPGRG